MVRSGVAGFAVLAGFVAAMVAGCERSGRSKDSNPAPTGSSARDAAQVSADAAPAVGMGVPRSGASGPNAAAVPTHDQPWRHALEEVARRFDRADPVARVAEVFGRLSTYPSGALKIESTLPWARTASVEIDEDEISFWLELTPRLLLLELEAFTGQCVAQPLGDFGDGAMMACPSFPTRRGIMAVDGTTDPHAGDGDNSKLDHLRIGWRPTPPAADAPPRSP